MRDKIFGTSRLLNIRTIAKAAQSLSLDIECKLKLLLEKGFVKVLFIHLNSNRLMSAYYVPDTGINAREMKMKEIISCLQRSHNQMEEMSE